MGALFMIYYSVSSFQGPLTVRFKQLGGLSLRFLALPLLLAPLILSLIGSPVDIGPSSPYAPPLSTFVSYSVPPTSVFLMMGYVGGPIPPNFLGYQMVAFSAGSDVAYIWMAFIVGLVLVVWLGLLILKDGRGYFLLGIATVGSLLGSGPYGPFGVVNVYLYLHLTGYQVINASYFWDWMLVVPSLSAGLGVLIERMVELTALGNSGHLEFGPGVEPGCNTSLLRKRTPRRRLRPSILYLAGTIIAVFAIVSSSLPFAVNAQNGPLGIQTIPYPSDYAQIPALLERLIGPSYAGVALFNPDVNWFLSNPSHAIPNAFFLYPTVRTPGLPFYTAPPFPGNFYNYWVYKEFYTNATRYVGELFGAEGVEYFLVLYGTQSASFYPYFLQFSYGKNASQLMNYQDGIIPILTSKTFAVYRNLYYSSVAASLSNISMVAGSYSELNAMAYAGINLTSQGIIFPSDIPPGDCSKYLERVGRIYAEATNNLYSLALTCSTVTFSNPVADISAGSQSWQSSYQDFGRPIWDAWPTPLATTYGSSYPIYVPINAQGCSSACSLWLPISFSGDGGLLKFQWRTGSWTVNTSRGWLGSNNSVAWVNLPFAAVQGTGDLRITSISGWNAVGTIYVASTTELSSWLENLYNSTPVYLLTSGETLQEPRTTSKGQFAGYCSLSIAGALGEKSLCLQAYGSTPLPLNLSLPDVSHGELSMLVEAIGTVTFLVDADHRQIYGFNTGNYNPANATMSWLRVPVNLTETTSNATLPLQIANGTAYISEIVFVPTGSYGTQSLALPGTNITLQSKYSTSTVTAFNVSIVRVSSTKSMISGAIRFRNAASCYDSLGNAIFRLATPLNSDMVIQYGISPGILIGVEGDELGGNDTAGPVQYGSAFSSTPSGLNRSILFVSFSAYGCETDSIVAANFTIWIEFAHMSLAMNVTDISRGANWTVSASDNGYSLEGGPGRIVLVRVPYFSDLTVTAKNVELCAALGSIDSIIWDQDNATSIIVTPATQKLLNSGYAVMGLSLVAWITVEYLWNRHRIRVDQRGSNSEPRFGKLISQERIPIQDIIRKPPHRK